MPIKNATIFLRSSRHGIIWPLVAAIGVYAAVFAIQLSEILRLTQGHQLYPLDDVYIHAAIAKNLLLHHVYGITQFGFSFPSSSILWPFVLVLAFAIVGVKAWVPLALNFLFSIVYLLFADHLLRILATSISPRMRFACLLLLVLGVPLIGLSFEGMEHVLHALSILLLLCCYLRTQVCRTAVSQVLLALSAAFAVSLRYESLFAVFLVTILLAWRRKWFGAAVVGTFAIIPVVAFGIFSHLHGSTFLPAPLLLKTSPSTQTSLLTAARNLFSVYSLLSGISVSFITATAFLVYLVRRPTIETQHLRDLFAVLFGTFILHAQLAHFGWLFRYEAYLLATTLVLVFAAVALLLDQARPVVQAMRQQWLSVGLVAILALAFAGRGESMLRGIPRDARAIYEQQYQTARFLATFYPGQVVGLNDIGAPDFYADIRCVDLLGLASSDVARLRRNGRFAREAVAQIATQRGIRVAALYPGLFAGQIPDSWIPVSTLLVGDLPGKVQLGERKVTFYATNQTEAAELAQQIQRFRPQLPSGVQVTDPNAPESTEAIASVPQRKDPVRGGRFLAWFHAGVDGLNNFP
jgi:hypothetical protein